MLPPGLIDQLRKMQGAGMPPTASNHMVGMAPPQQPFPGGSGQALQPFMANGPYGLQAMQLAGLLGGSGGGQQFPVGGPYQPGRFMPGFRPGVDQPITNGSARNQGSPRRRVSEY